ncbi:MAG: hypothetical protein HY053_04350, partial [Proteobacteria bacterium]|nr:hypothetical protein [Pseudomonadota bacterium]
MKHGLFFIFLTTLLFWFPGAAWANADAELMVEVQKIGALIPEDPSVPAKQTTIQGLCLRIQKCELEYMDAERKHPLGIANCPKA